MFSKRKKQKYCAKKGVRSDDFVERNDFLFVLPDLEGGNNSSPYEEWK